MVALKINTQEEVMKVKELVLSFFTLNDLEKARLKNIINKNELEYFLENPDSCLDDKNVVKFTAFLDLIKLIQDETN